MKIKRKRIRKLICDLKRANSIEFSTAQVMVDWSDLRSRYLEAHDALPYAYKNIFYHPLGQYLFGFMNAASWDDMLDRDPGRTGMARLADELCQAVLQRADPGDCMKQSTEAFQEVVSDLFDGFLSAGDRHGVKRPDRAICPPLVKWSTNGGPYSIPVDVAAHFGTGAGVINLPGKYAFGGLAAWAVLAHEVGHDVLHADIGLRAELARNVYDAVAELGGRNGANVTGLGLSRSAECVAPYTPETELEEPHPSSNEDDEKDFRPLAHFIAQRIDETTSDILAVLNMGPCAAISLMSYLVVFEGDEGRNTADKNKKPIFTFASAVNPLDTHLPGFLRAYIMRDTIRYCEFEEKNNWLAAIDHHLLPATEVSEFEIGSVIYSPTDWRRAIEAAVHTMCTKPLKSLENLSLSFIQNWRQIDQFIVDDLVSNHFESRRQLLESDAARVYAAHVVAGAIQSVLFGKCTSTKEVFGEMVDLLQFLHQFNPAWGNLGLAFRGDLESSEHNGCESSEAPTPLTKSKIRFSHRVLSTNAEDLGQCHGGRLRPPKNKGTWNECAVAQDMVKVAFGSRSKRTPSESEPLAGAPYSSSSGDSIDAWGRGASGVTWPPGASGEPWGPGVAGVGWPRGASNNAWGRGVAGVGWPRGVSGDPW